MTPILREKIMALYHVARAVIQCSRRQCDSPCPVLDDAELLTACPERKALSIPIGLGAKIVALTWPKGTLVRDESEAADTGRKSRQ